LYQTATFPTFKGFDYKALQWADQYPYCAWFNPNDTKNYPYDPFRNFIAIGSKSIDAFTGTNDFESLLQHIEHNKHWLIGHLSYDLKNQLEVLTSQHHTPVDFPLINFFIPDHLIFFKPDHIEIKSTSNPQDIYEQIKDYSYTQKANTFNKPQLKTSQQTYIETVRQLINHIVEGDIYEINYCIQYIIDELKLDPIMFYKELCNLSPTPFSTFYKSKSQYALGASPERFMKKTDRQLISQPIKGTAKRGSTQKEDESIISALRNDEKEMAENMMIVDLVRNDLARSSVAGSVKVKEMFGIYSFKHWHQMISTVEAQSRAEVSAAEIIKNAFPMGSMTGAPKIKVMELVEKYENFKRGLYAGSIGYITPDNDFDFNVVIRTLLYDQTTSKGAFMVGSAITYDAEPEKEYEECLLKAKPILQTLEKLRTLVQPQ